MKGNCGEKKNMNVFSVDFSIRIQDKKVGPIGSGSFGGGYGWEWVLIGPMW